MKSIGIIGLGLIGGSLARALKRTPGTHITAMSRNEDALSLALADGMADVVTTNDFTRFAGCDVVFICVPVPQIAACAKELAGVVRKGCIVTDVGSVKSPVMRDMEPLELCFIGGHPMAGSEKSGYSASAAYLFENAHYILTPSSKATETSISQMRTLVSGLGAIPVVMDAAYHDQIVAAISHGPHVAAAALVNAVAVLDDKQGHTQALAAGGFKDITRIASSDGALWQSICMENRGEVLRFMRAYRDQTEAFIQALEAGAETALQGLFESAKVFRDGFAATGRSLYTETFIIHMDVLDKPGSIATVAALLSANAINIKNIGIVHNREYHDGVLQILLDCEDDRLRAAALLRGMNFTVYE